MAEKNSMRKYNSTKQSQAPSPLGEGRGGGFSPPRITLCALPRLCGKRVDELVIC